MSGESVLVISRVLSAEDTVTRDIGVEAVLTAIRTGGKKLPGQITQIRNKFEAELAIAQANAEAGQNVNPLQVAKLAVSELKKQLPAVMWCGQFSSREEPAAEKLQKHSGLFCGDLDDLGPELPRVREQLQTSPHIFAPVPFTNWQWFETSVSRPCRCVKTRGKLPCSSATRPGANWRPD